ncbi:MAG: YitT family protein [Oscillospiraceae bacterium]|nr:YitT family protein [Oscillospiraceae bacterium]
MKKKEITKRYILFIISLFVSGLGVAITKRGELGVSPISSTANVLSMKWTALSLGTWLLVWNTSLVLGQIIILRRKFQLIQLLQIPLSVLFGWFTDLGMSMTGFMVSDIYAIRLMCVLLGTAVLALGVALAVIANVIMNSGEAFVKAVADAMNKQFGDIKIFFDVGCVIFALIMSLILFNFKIIGAREGTIIAAFCTGIAVKFYLKTMKKPLDRILEK